jgi:hypothetical protein
MLLEYVLEVVLQPMNWTCISGASWICAWSHLVLVARVREISILSLRLYLHCILMLPDLTLAINFLTNNNWDTFHKHYIIGNYSFNMNKMMLQHRAICLISNTKQHKQNDVAAISLWFLESHQNFALHPFRRSSRQTTSQPRPKLKPQDEQSNGCQPPPLPTNGETGLQLPPHRPV